MLAYPAGQEIEVSKIAKIRNRYNQVPHLTQEKSSSLPILCVCKQKMLEGKLVCFKLCLYGKNYLILSPVLDKRHSNTNKITKYNSAEQGLSIWTTGKSIYNLHEPVHEIWSYRISVKAYNNRSFWRVQRD